MYFNKSMNRIHLAVFFLGKNSSKHIRVIWQFSIDFELQLFKNEKANPRKYFKIYRIVFLYYFNQ